MTTEPWARSRSTSVIGKARKAKTTKYVCKVVLEEGTFAYESCTTYHHHAGGEIAHTDRNVLRRV